MQARNSSFGILKISGPRITAALPTPPHPNYSIILAHGTGCRSCTAGVTGARRDAGPRAPVLGANDHISRQARVWLARVSVTWRAYRPLPRPRRRVMVSSVRVRWCLSAWFEDDLVTFVHYGALAVKYSVTCVIIQGRIYLWVDSVWFVAWVVVELWIVAWDWVICVLRYV